MRPAGSSGWLLICGPLGWMVTSSPYFNRDIYLLENRNAKSRMRDSKRVMYREFLTWCENRDDLPEFSIEDKEEYRKEQLSNALSRFPEFKRRYDDVIIRLEHSKKLRSKFNGDIVRKITGFYGASLGIFIKEFRILIFKLLKLL